MRDWSSVIDAGLVVMGAITMLAIGLSTVSASSDPVSVSDSSAQIQSHHQDINSLLKAA